MMGFVKDESVSEEIIFSNHNVLKLRSYLKSPFWLSLVDGFVSGVLYFES